MTFSTNFMKRRGFCTCSCGFAVATFMPRLGSTAIRRSGSGCNVSFNSSGGDIDKRTIRPLSAIGDDYANALLPIVTDISEYLGVSVAIGIYADREHPNAAYSSDPEHNPLPKRVRPAADGTILLGQALLKELRELYIDLSAPLTALCAHEAAHALQKKHGVDNWQSYSTGDDDERFEDRYELCADFICGAYGAHRQVLDQTYPAAVQAETQFSKGDHKPIGHGTFEQRGSAVAAGYRLAKKRRISGKELLQAGHTYAKGLEL